MHGSFDSANKNQTVYVPVGIKFYVQNLPFRKNNDGNNSASDEQVEQGEEEIEDEDDIAKSSYEVKFGEEINITDEYKNGNVNASATKMPMSHVWEEANGNKVTFIDTPGINSTIDDDDKEASEEADESIVTFVLNHISHYPYINAFVVFLRPNQEKLSQTFRSTLKKIFNQLEKSAKNNIVFAFTRAKDCNFHETTTTQALLKFIKKEDLNIKLTRSKIFHFDNSPFRYLATKCTSNQPTDEGFIMKDCWDKSINNCNKMISYIAELEEYNTSIIKSIKKTKRMIKLAINPLVKICKVNEENQISLTEAYDTLAKEPGTKLISVPGKYLTFKKLKKPYTVCTNEKCYKQETYLHEGKNVKKNIYNPICCNNCIVPLHSHDEKGSAMLWFCKAINWKGKCKNEQCGHMRSEHVHIAYELNEAESYFNLNTKNVQTKLTDLKKEIDIITNALAYFSRYLDHHSFFSIHKGFVDKFFQKQLTKSIEELDSQTKLKGDLEKKIKLQNSEKEPCIFLQGRIKEFQEELEHIDEKISLIQEVKDIEPRKNNQIKPTIRQLKLIKEAKMLMKEEDMSYQRYLAKLKVQRKFITTALKGSQEQIEEFEECGRECKDITDLVACLRAMQKNYEDKKEDNEDDLTEDKCYEMIDSLCKMTPDGKIFEDIYDQIKQEDECVEFFLKNLYRNGRRYDGGKHDEVPKKNFYRKPSENSSS